MVTGLVVYCEAYSRTFSRAGGLHFCRQNSSETALVQMLSIYQHKI